jgi:NAD(P)-dependent dehydrogenase (short-subunit alcohol dehydrogenase family)
MRDRLVVVTGSASGIGLATVRELRNAGDAILGVDLSGAPGDLAGADGVDWIRGDVREQDTWDQVAAAVKRHRNDGADALIACAADVSISPFLQTPLDEWRRLFDINVFGVIRAFQALLPAMVERRRGAIAVVCSVNSLMVEDRLSAYSTSKAALLHVVRAAALEHARHGVHINAVCPGTVDTPLLRRHYPVEEIQAAAKRQPNGEVLRPEEIARVLRFLVSDDARAMSGAAVVVDGGLTITYDFNSQQP